jgi:hypothetical protein
LTFLACLSLRIPRYRASCARRLRRPAAWSTDCLVTSWASSFSLSIPRPVAYFASNLFEFIRRSAYLHRCAGSVLSLVNFGAHQKSASALCKLANSIGCIPWAFHHEIHQASADRLSIFGTRPRWRRGALEDATVPSVVIPPHPKGRRPARLRRHLRFFSKRTTVVAWTARAKSAASRKLQGQLPCPKRCL